MGSVGSDRKSAVLPSKEVNLLRYTRVKLAPSLQHQITTGMRSTRITGKGLGHLPVFFHRRTLGTPYGRCARMTEVRTSTLTQTVKVTRRGSCWLEACLRVVYVRERKPEVVKPFVRYSLRVPVVIWCWRLGANLTQVFVGIYFLQSRFLHTTLSC